MNSSGAVATLEPQSLVVRKRMVAFVGDDISAAALRTGLDGIPQTLEVRRGNIHNAVRLLGHDTDFHAIIADITDVDDLEVALEDFARVCPMDVQVALIGPRTDIVFYRKLLDIGVREYLPKPITRDSVQMLLRPRLVGNESDQAFDRGGHVVAICGAQGGAGATSIAVNLALQLAETTKARVALLDLHLQGGEVSVLLGVRPGPGLRIALEDPLRADSLFLERTGIEVNKHVRLIAGDEAMGEVLLITEAGLRHVLSLLRQRFSYIVIDVPMPLAPALHPAISLARHVFVLLEAEVTGLRNAQALRAMVTDITKTNRVFVVLNRANRPGGLPISAVTKGLGLSPDIVIPDLGKRMTEAVNQGIPALYRLPGLRRYLAPMVREIAGLPVAGRGSWIRRLFRR